VRRGEKPEKPKVCERDTKKTLSFFAPPEKQQLIYCLTFAAAAGIIFFFHRAAFGEIQPRAPCIPAEQFENSAMVALFRYQKKGY